MLSRILGFIRDVVIAHAFGAGMAADAFFVALKLPNFLRRLFSEGAFSTAFVPVFSDYRAEGDTEQIRTVVQSVFTTLALVLLAVVAVGELLMPLLITVAAPGFRADPVKFGLAVDLTRVTFPYILFISLVALAGGVLNSYRRFVVPAATPTILNITLIIGAVALAPLFTQPAMGLAVGVLAGGVIQLAIQWPALARVGTPFRWRWDPHHPAIQRILLLMGPSVLGVSVAQINLLFDLFIASWLPEGSISYLYYADRLVEFPLGLIGIAMGTAILPTLSDKASRCDIDGLKQDLDFALRLIVVVNIPATVGLLLLREPLLTLLFQGGAFDSRSTELTARALLAYGSGLLAFSAIKVIAPAFYAMKDTRTPVRIAITAMISNMVLNLLLMAPLQHVGLALATSLSAFLNMGLLLYHLNRSIGYRMGQPLWSAVWRTTLASGAMGGLLVLWQAWLWQPQMSTLHQAALMTGAITAAVLLFGAVAWLLRLHELRELLQIIRHSRGQS
ncbi:MAG: murein biosynthesis integral membrane protein MurJ [Magnetococcales bacterium]|nr:murein biosynthesis integral membrane protein MurJ [Magnetococcales bacterium]